MCKINLKFHMHAHRQTQAGVREMNSIWIICVSKIDGDFVYKHPAYLLFIVVMSIMYSYETYDLDYLREKKKDVGRGE